MKTRVVAALCVLPLMVSCQAERPPAEPARATTSLFAKVRARTALALADRDEVSTDDRPMAEGVLLLVRGHSGYLMR